MMHAFVTPERAAIERDDIAGRSGVGTQFLDQAGIIAVGHEADVLAVRLVGHRQPE